MRRALVIAVIALVGIPALPALAKSFWIDNADVTVTVNDDGSLDVVELVTFDFSGSFSGAYRDIPLTRGSIESITVSDELVEYQPGGCTALGCSSPPGTYGVEQYSDLVRIVWHHSSSDELRTFRISYRLVGFAVAYDDVVDINLKVWGDQWAVGLNSLQAEMLLPDGLTAGDVK